MGSPFGQNYLNVSLNSFVGQTLSHYSLSQLLTYTRYLSHTPHTRYLSHTPYTRSLSLLLSQIAFIHAQIRAHVDFQSRSPLGRK